MKIHLSKWQTQVWNDTHRFKIIDAGRRSGKSVLAQLWTIHKASEEIGVYWIIAPTYRQAKQIHWIGIQQLIPPAIISKKNEVELSITLVNGSIIELKGAENPDTLRGVKLRGLVLDEIAAVRNWDWLWSEVLRPTLTDYTAPGLFISSPKGFNHFYDLYQMGQSGGPDYKSWRFTSYDNPYIPSSEIDAAKEELTEDTFHQEYMADFRKYTGLVYKEFDRSIHVKEIPDFVPVYYIRGGDLGYRNPTAIPLIAVDKDGIWYQISEIYKRELTPIDLAPLLKQQRGGKELEYSIIDGKPGEVKELCDLGEDFIPVTKSSGETNMTYVQFKIKLLAQRLKVKADGKAGYYVHPSCTETLREFESYRWKEHREAGSTGLNAIEEPEKAYDHMMDALSDLNAMYQHDYSPVETKPWANKVPGTYVPPSPVLADEENDWGLAIKIEEW